MPSFLAGLLREQGEVIPFTSLGEWWDKTAELRAAHPSTVERAISMGFHSDRVGMAFAGGYTSAMVAMDAGLVAEPGAFCATEDDGGHPRAVKTRLEKGRVTGTKRFVSFGPFAKTLLVVASEGTTADGRNQLRAVRVAASLPGVTLERGPSLPFVPEVPHASVSFDDVPGEVLHGDGYEHYLKPFRTIEDLHVNAAILSYVMNVGLRFEWPEETCEQLLAVLTAACSLGLEDPRLTSTHLALAGILGFGRRVLEDAAPLWEKVEAEEKARFGRDRPLLEVAGKAREARRHRAWADLTSRHR